MDPAALTALLDDLRASSAWQTIVAAQPAPEPSVAELLAQLRTPGAASQPPPFSGASHQPPPPPANSGPQPAAPPRIYSFHEALPLLSRLGDNPAFVDTIKDLRQDQDSLERKLLADREAIQRKYADRIKVAQTKAAMTGATGISKHDAAMIQDAYKKELLQFDKDRVLPAWDALATRQQAQLESLGVPNMYVSSDLKDRERQRKIIQVLVDLAGDSDL